MHTTARTLRVGLLAIATALCFASATSAYTISLDDQCGGCSGIVNIIDDPSNRPVQGIDTAQVTALPFSHSTAIADGNLATLSAEHLFSNDGFAITVEHMRSGCCLTNREFARSNGNLRFSVDEQINYMATGSYSAVDVGSVGGYVGLAGSLFDETTSVYAFQSEQSSDLTANESFELGGTEGDLINRYQGSLTGILLPGHIYRFDYDMRISGKNIDGVMSPVTALGDIALEFSPIPEPNTALLVSLGLVAIAANRNRAR